MNERVQYGMISVAMVAFFGALLPILLVGTALMELLLADAPRRGKRPDVKGRERAPKPSHVRVVAPDGHLSEGAPVDVLANLRPHGFPDAPRFVFSDRDAWRWLDRWEKSGRLLMETRWR